LNGKYRKNWGHQTRGQTKIWRDYGLPIPLKSPLGQGILPLLATPMPIASSANFSDERPWPNSALLHLGATAPVIA